MTSRIQTVKMYAEDIEVSMLIGVLPREQLAQQRVLVSLDVDVSIPREAMEGNELEKLLSYDTLIAAIHTTCLAQRFFLMETYALAVGEAVMALPFVQAVTIKAYKPEILDAGRLGVSISLTKGA